MSRNRVPDAVKEYSTKHVKTAPFYLSDILGVYEMSQGNRVDMITIALKAGFVIGYRKCKRDLAARS